MERKSFRGRESVQYYGRSENQTKALDGISFQVFCGGVFSVLWGAAGLESLRC